MAVKHAFGTVLTCALLLGCDGTETAPVAPGPSEAEVKELVSKAAGMPGDVFRRIVERGGLPQRKDFPNHYLTLDLLSMTPDEVSSPKEGTSRESQVKARAPNPAALADALAGGRKPIHQVSYASVIWPDYITELKTERSGDEITGWAGFEAPGLYSGRVEFTLAPIRSGPGWKVTRLAMPSRNLALRLAEDGTWQTASQ